MKECPEGKIRNPSTNRCVNKNGKIGKALLTKKPSLALPKSKPTDCPEGKILNPTTKRCVSVTGKIGKQLLKGKQTPSKAVKAESAPPKAPQQVPDAVLKPCFEMKNMSYNEVIFNPFLIHKGKKVTMSVQVNDDDEGLNFTKDEEDNLVIRVNHDAILIVTASELKMEYIPIPNTSIAKSKMWWFYIRMAVHLLKHLLEGKIPLVKFLQKKKNMMKKGKERVEAFLKWFPEFQKKQDVSTMKIAVHDKKWKTSYFLEEEEEISDINDLFNSYDEEKVEEMKVQFEKMYYA